MPHQDLDCHYEAYVAGEKAADRSPLGQFGWLRLVTANELAGCEKALEAIQARKDESERPRKKVARHEAEATAFEAERILVPGAGAWIIFCIMMLLSTAPPCGEHGPQHVGYFYKLLRGSPEHLAATVTHPTWAEGVDRPTKRFMS